MSATARSSADHWSDALAALLPRAGQVVLVTVADARGPTPRESGAAMIVTTTDVVGTIGGGPLEFEATRIAREALCHNDASPATWLVRFPLATRFGQACGGIATVAFQTITADTAAWLEPIRACLRTQSVIALVARVGKGTGAAARLLVTADDARGTLGDAAADSAAIGAARERLAAGPGDAKSGSGVIERKAATLFIHLVRRPDFSVLVFGNGHVGRALVHVLGATPARVTWVDERADGFPADIPANVAVVATDTPETELRAAPTGSFVVILTHSHALDFGLAVAALARSDWRYVGMIGSMAKRAQLAHELGERGFPPDALARITMPIGSATASIRSKEPGAIAVAVAAEILAVRERSTAQPTARTTAGAR
jgi:xanthine dehydrogenase accessory factor